MRSDALLAAVCAWGAVVTGLAARDLRGRDARLSRLRPASALLGPQVLWRKGLGVASRLSPVRGVLSERRHRRAETQVPDALALLVGSLRAGASVVQALSAAALETPGPLGEVLSRASAEVSLGRPVEEALETAGVAAGLNDLRAAAAVLGVARRSGAPAARVLSALAEGASDRLRLRAEIAAETAQARASALVVAVLPVGLFAVEALIAPRQAALLVTTPLGWAALLVGMSLEAVGVLWVRRVLRRAEGS
ncbi:MAG: type II secretion system F family protein [Actinomycetota bacterium]